MAGLGLVALGELLWMIISFFRPAPEKKLQLLYSM